MLHHNTAGYIVFSQELSWTTPHFTKIIRCISAVLLMSLMFKLQSTIIKHTYGVIRVYCLYIQGATEQANLGELMSRNAPIQEKYSDLMWGTLVIYSVTRVILESQVFFLSDRLFPDVHITAAAYKSNYTDNHITL